MANLLALGAAFMFALAATLQQKGALGMGEVSLGSPKSFLNLAKQTWWLLGTLALLGGYVLQAAALDRGDLAVIQPLLVTTIVFALPLGYLLTHQAVSRRQVASAGLVVLGLATFTVVGKAAAGNDDTDGWKWAVTIGVVAIAVAALMFTGGRGSLSRKAAAYGASAGILYGLSASLWNPTHAAFSADGLAGMLGAWEFWVFAAAGILAFLLQQVSLATGRLAPSVAMTSVLNPLVSVAIGILLFQEYLADPNWHKVVAYAGLALALFAAVTITKETEGAREAEPAPS